MEGARGTSEQPTRAHSGVVCEQCGGRTQTAGELCVSCLLRGAIAGDALGSAAEIDDIAADEATATPQRRLRNYDILNEIGRGSMGVIYRAHERDSGRIVAVKRVLGFHADSPDHLQRFRREAEAAASLDHPHILPIYEVGEGEDGVPFFSMKWATGGSLGDAGPAMRGDAPQCARLMAKVARAIDYAHAKGILHRDLQPGNILLDGDGEPLVSDFGLAKWLWGESNLTRTVTTLGTPGYIAPEQTTADGGKVSAAADIYSLGAVLFNLLAGRPPFEGGNSLSIVRQAAEKAAPKLRTIVPSIPRDLETIADRCLERDPRARYASAGAVADDLERWLAARRIVARPLGPSKRLWRWSCRNPALAGAAAICVALAAAVAWLLFVADDGDAPPATAEKSVAVLPFENLSGDAENLFFADGMQEDILTDLGRIADLKVISRSSVSEYEPRAPRNLRAIGRTLGVRNLLEGSVRRANGRLRINARLTDAQTGAQLWAEEYDRDLADVFAIQSEIAQKIASRLQAQLSPEEKATIAATPTSDLQAYDLYLQAKEIARNVSLWSPDRARSEIALLEQAVGRDPTFVAALCTLARAHLELYWYNYEHTAEALDAAARAIESAARIQPQAGEVHLARAILHYWGHRDYASALPELAEATKALPNDADVAFFAGLIARRQGDWEASTRHLERAKTIDPLGVRSLFELGRSNLFALKRYAEAAQLCDSVLAWRPADFDFQVARAKVDVASRADLTAFRAVVVRGAAESQPPAGLSYARLELALAERNYEAAARALTAFPPAEIIESGYITPQEFYAGVIAQGRGDGTEARAAFLRASDIATARLMTHPDNAKALIVQAEIDARLGRKEEAIRHGERARELMPVAKDAVDGVVIMVRLAGVYAQVHEPGRALDLLAQSAPLPGATNYGELMLDERWDPLRGEPRFKAIVASLAPPPAPAPE